jgi:hypothetical protein
VALLVVVAALSAVVVDSLAVPVVALLRLATSAVDPTTSLVIAKLKP